MAYPAPCRQGQTLNPDWFHPAKNTLVIIMLLKKFTNYVFIETILQHTSSMCVTFSEASAVADINFDALGVGAGADARAEYDR